MGGNVTAIIKHNGQETRAEKIPVKDIGRKEFITTFIKVFKELNKIFKKEHGVALWLKEKNLENGLQYNGSTSYIFDPSIDDIELIKHKETAGDIDIIVPDGFKEELWNTLDKLEGKEIMKGVYYMGSNKPTVSSIGEQINCVFVVDFKGRKVAAQVDFEFLPMESDNATPTEWAKFSHSSSFEDAKAGVKAVHHKYLIQALVGGASMRDDIVIATPSSTPVKIKLKKMKEGDIPRMLKFSVGRGIGVAYEIMRDENGNVIQMDGKDVYREMKPAERTYETVVGEIYKLAFGRLEDHPEDVRLFNSFVGVIQLMKKYLNKKQIDATHKRYVEKLWQYKIAQVLERGNAEADYAVKISGYNYFLKEMKLKADQKSIDAYYKDFPDRDLTEGLSMIREALDLARV